MTAESSRAEAGSAGCCGRPQRGVGCGPDDGRGEERVKALFDSAGGADLAVELLDERNPAYEGVGAPAVRRMRGALLLCLGRAPLGPEGLAFVLGELGSAHDPYLAAAAARSLRRAGTPDAAMVAPILRALETIGPRDDAVSLTTYGGVARDDASTSAVAEILQTLEWLRPSARDVVAPLRAIARSLPPGPVAASVSRAAEALEARPHAAGCCGAGTAPRPTVAGPPTPSTRPDGVVFEDQDGVRLRFDEYFVGRPTIVVFFYTRCENRNKCPATISMLGELQRRLAAPALRGKVRTAAITYDPAYDVPAELERYRRTWGAEKGPDARMLRTVGPFDAVRDFFGLGMSSDGSIVTQHRLEACVVDPRGQIASRILRRQWAPQELIEEALARI